MSVDLNSRGLTHAWLFAFSGGDRWSTQAITVSGQDYLPRVDPDSFAGVTIARDYDGAGRIHTLEDVSIEIPAQGITCDFAGQDVTVSIWIDDGVTSEIVRSFLYTVKMAKKLYDVIHITFQDQFAYHDLDVFYPDTPLISTVWASDGDSNLGYCMPEPFGTAYIPLPSVYIDDRRYYVLGQIAGSYTINEVRSPDSWPLSVWSAPEHTFSQSTHAGYRVCQALIADSDSDGVADANGLFKDGSVFLPITTKYSRSDTAAMTDPAAVVASMIFGGSHVAVVAGSLDGEPQISGAFYARQQRYIWAAHVLAETGAALIITSTGERIVSSLSATPVANLSSSEIIQESFGSTQVVSDEQYDGGLIQLPNPNAPQQVLYTYQVGLGNAAPTNPTDDVLLAQFATDPSVAVRMGTLHFERIVGRVADISFSCWVSSLMRNPDEVINVTGAEYDAATAQAMVITSVEITSDLIVNLRCEQFGHSLNNFSDLSENLGLIPALDDSTGEWSTVIVGPDGSINTLTKNLIIGEGGMIKVNIDPTANGGLKIDGTHMAGYADGGVKTMEITYGGPNAGNVMFGGFDGIGGNGLLYDYASGLLSMCGTLTISSGSTGYKNLDDAPTTLGAISPEEYAKLVATHNFVTITYPDDKVDIEDSIDGKIDSWFMDADPSLSWAGTDASHEGDMWYSSSEIRLKRWDGSIWHILDDLVALAAYGNAATAQDTADGKRRVFVVTPSGPYDIGDLWDTDSGIKRATVDRATGYYASDWVLIGDVTDYDTIGEDAQNRADSAETNAKDYTDDLKGNLKSLAYKDAVTINEMDTALIIEGKIKADVIQTGVFLVGGDGLSVLDSGAATKLNGIDEGADVTENELAGGLITGADISNAKANGYTLIQGSYINTGILKVGRAEIIDLAVNTLKIADNAVTIPVSAYTAASYNMDEDVEYNAQIASISTGGEPIFITCSLSFYGVGSGEFRLRLVRDSTELYTITSFLRESIQSFNIVDTPSAGTHTYYLKATRYYEPGSMGNRSITLLGVKK